MKWTKRKQRQARNSILVLFLIVIVSAFMTQDTFSVVVKPSGGWGSIAWDDSENALKLCTDTTNSWEYGVQDSVAVDPYRISGMTEQRCADYGYNWRLFSGNLVIGYTYVCDMTDMKQLHVIKSDMVSIKYDDYKYPAETHLANIINYEIVQPFTLQGEYQYIDDIYEKDIGSLGQKISGCIWVSQQPNPDYYIDLTPTEEPVFGYEPWQTPGYVDDTETQTEQSEDDNTTIYIFSAMVLLLGGLTYTFFKLKK